MTYTAYNKPLKDRDTGGYMKSQMREMGGYLELERFSGHEYHEGALALDCARNCLAYLIEARRIETIWIPSFLCASVDGAARRTGAQVRTYEVLPNFTPDWDTVELGTRDYFYLVDYYGQLDASTFDAARARAGERLIVDEVMAFFRKPLPHTDTIYSCRKFFGVADGGYLYTNALIDRELSVDSSHDRMDFVLGRCERPANDFYAQASANNGHFNDEGPKLMSPITHNILRAVDYEAAAQHRLANFEALAARLDGLNELKPVPTYGAFMYPLLVQNGAALRKRLQARKLYVSTLWPYACDCPGIAGRYARDILPLIVDQRYDLDDMTYEADMVLEELEA